MNSEKTVGAIRDGPGEKLNTARAAPLDSTSHPRSERPPARTSQDFKTVREYYVAVAKNEYPEENVEQLDDLHLIYSYQRLAGDGKLSYDQFIKNFQDECEDESSYTGEVIEVEALATAKLDKPLTVIGVTHDLLFSIQASDSPSQLKPVPGEEDVHYTSIPGSNLALRIWGKGMEDEHYYCLDFVDKDTLQAVNMPSDFKLYTVPPMDSWWRPHFGGQMFSLESEFQVPQQELKAGEEKFLLSEGDCIRLSRKGAKELYVNVPIRPRDRRPPWLRGAYVSTFGPASALDSAPEAGSSC
ncbi:uncharacterized protein LAESUDRAFT_747054 [Laetiporus sulphureus 93-53]|uniref:Uncharacterized protein n=1 Tax=Laetiporus sulphureus 93-53 TaxID=1314785 RepID=A0A165H6A0_9APHY|nr:uncharacterized protein LAESUDRAFT_747054 [Laetiporus sulphureus 93-53]KZT11299.1 hypothetical protein LAESUDRAFT_747054 [Laetiporus sulphureus 93-53]